MKCPSCEAELPAAFPGAVLTCACGVQVTLPAVRPSPIATALASASRGSVAPTSGGGPYRASAVVAPDGAPVPCPYCGNPCPPLVRVCLHCDVRLDNVRCGRCYSLQAPGVFDCVRCGQPLELEPVLDATDAPCPRCRSPLEASAAGARPAHDGLAGDPRIHECPRCGGMFVPREVLADILARAEVRGAVPEVRTVPPLDAVTYIPCPMCHASMNRVNFGKLSGVIVDVCRAHGTWFDAGELTRVVAFAASGGLQKTRARERAEKKELDARLSAPPPLETTTMFERYEMENRAQAWSDFLHAIFFW